MEQVTKLLTLRRVAFRAVPGGKVLNNKVVQKSLVGGGALSNIPLKSILGIVNLDCLTAKPFDKRKHGHAVG